MGYCITAGPSPSVILVRHIFHLGSDGSNDAALVRQIALFHYLSVEKSLQSINCLFHHFPDTSKSWRRDFTASDSSHVATNLRLRLHVLHLAHTASGLFTYDSGE
jgi:hypothetical protein